MSWLWKGAVKVMKKRKNKKKPIIQSKRGNEDIRGLIQRYQLSYKPWPCFSLDIRLPDYCHIRLEIIKGNRHSQTRQKRVHLGINTRVCHLSILALNFSAQKPRVEAALLQNQNIATIIKAKVRMECVFACQTLAYFDEPESVFLFVKQYLLTPRASFLPHATRMATHSCGDSTVKCFLPLSKSLFQRWLSSSVPLYFRLFTWRELLIWRSHYLDIQYLHLLFNFHYQIESSSSDFHFLL